MISRFHSRVVVKTTTIIALFLIFIGVPSSVFLNSSEIISQPHTEMKGVSPKDAQSSPYSFIWENNSNLHGDIPGDDVLTWGEGLGIYHNNSELSDKIGDMEQHFPEWIEVFSIGQTYYGRDIPCVRITDELVTESKERVLIVGQHNARHQITRENALYFVDRLLHEISASNETIKALLGQKEIFIIPCLNMDGASILAQFPWQHQTLRPYDSDGDGLGDEWDGQHPILEPSDVNGDGYIEEYWIQTQNNDFAPWGYEGLDLDQDGRIGEDIPGGVDPEKNFPESFGLPHFSSDNIAHLLYHGPAPLSENCTASLAEFVLQENFSRCISLQSGNQFFFSPPLRTGKLGTIYDSEMYQSLGGELFAITGWQLTNNWFSSGSFCEWAYWGDPKIPFALTIDVYSNITAYEENFDQNSRIITAKGGWDYFNPCEQAIYSQSELITRVLLHIINFRTAYSEQAEFYPVRPIINVILVFSAMIAGGYAAFWLIRHRLP